MGEIIDLACKRGVNLASDILAGKPSELEVQTGAVVRMARDVSIAVPINQLIYNCLILQETRARADPVAQELQK